MHKETTDLDDGQSDSIKHDVSAIFLHDLDLLCEDTKQVNTCWGVESPVVASLGRVRPICFQNIGVPFLQNIQIFNTSAGTRQLGGTKNHEKLLRSFHKFSFVKCHPF